MTLAGEPEKDNAGTVTGTASGGDSDQGAFDAKMFDPTSDPRFIFGRFRAHFSDGSAIGAFNTKNDAAN